MRRPQRAILIRAAAVLFAVHVATAQAPIRNGATAVGSLQIATGILHGGAVSATESALPPFLPNIDDAPRPGSTLASAGLTINAVFDSSIVSNPNAAQIEATINAAIADIQSRFADPITVTINFRLMSTGLGQSSTYFGNISYSTFIAALKGDGKT